MKKYFSPLTKGFYLEEFKASYQKNASWPADLIEIPEPDYLEFALSPTPLGKELVFLEGKLLWSERAVSEEQTISHEHHWIDAEMGRIRDELEKVQDGDPSAVGSVSEWRAYRRALRKWKEEVTFSNTELRPKAPDINKK